MRKITKYRHPQGETALAMFIGNIVYAIIVSTISFLFIHFIFTGLRDGSLL